MLEEQGADPSVIPGLSYGIAIEEIDTIVPMGDLRREVALAHASCMLARRLYAALRAMQDDGRITNVHLAVVHGNSILFPKRIWFWSLIGGIPRIQETEDMLEYRDLDSPTKCMARKKRAEFLVRQFMRYCISNEALQETPIAPCPAHFLLYAPESIHMPGWAPRPHWKPELPEHWDHPSEKDIWNLYYEENGIPIPKEDEQTEAAQPSDAHSESDTQQLPPLRSSRMQLPTSVRNYKHTPSSFQSRFKNKAQPKHTMLYAGLLYEPCEQSHVWFECDVVAGGVS